MSDREPIVDKHIFLLANKHISSFADLSDPSHLALLFDENRLLSVFGNEQLLFVERGRAKFCTSEFTDSHAHGYIVPLRLFKESTVDELKATTNAIAFPSLSSALMFAKERSSEYFLFSVNGAMSYLPSLIHLSRRKNVSFVNS